MKRTSPLRRIGSRLAGDDLVLDLGTANVRMLVRDRGLILSEPSVVAVDDAGNVVAAGDEAVDVVRRRAAGIRLHRPLRGGVIADPGAATVMVRRFLAGTGLGAGHRPAVVVCVPSDITAQQRAAFQDVVVAAGARAGYVIEDPVAAAIGSGLPIADEAPSVLIDIGAGTADVAILSMGGIVLSRSVPAAGDDIDEAIAAHLQRQHGLHIGRWAAERVKTAVRQAVAGGGWRSPIEVRGRRAGTGERSAAVVSAAEAFGAARPVVDRSVTAVRDTLAAASPRLAADLVDRPALLTGGTALLPGVAERIADATGLPLLVSDDPLHRVAAGAAACLDTTDDLSTLFAGVGPRG